MPETILKASPFMERHQRTPSAGTLVPRDQNDQADDCRQSQTAGVIDRVEMTQSAEPLRAAGGYLG
jgi:hypothetical protein